MLLSFSDSIGGVFPGQCIISAGLLVESSHPELHFLT